MQNSGTNIEKIDTVKPGILNFQNQDEDSSTLKKADMNAKSCSVKSISHEDISAVNVSTEVDNEIYGSNSSDEVDGDTSHAKDKEESSALNISTESKEDSSISNVFDEQILSNSIEVVTVEDELREIFSRCSQNFNVLHINAQSIPAHHLTMLATFVSLHNLDAILVSESFLKPKIDSELVELPGFNLIRNDREDAGCGGVAIYLRKGFTFKIVAQSFSINIICPEYLYIEVFNEKTKILLGVFYSPSSKVEYFPTFEMLLIKYRSLYKHINILGDFNTDFFKRAKRLKKLLSIVDEQNLRILPLGPTHFAPHSVESLLDLIIVSDSDEVVKHGQIDGYFSYHDLIYLSCKLQYWKERESPSDIAVCNEITFWQKEIVKKALYQQLCGLRKYKESSRSDEDVKEYQISRKPIQILEKEFKRILRKTKKQDK